MPESLPARKILGNILPPFAFGQLREESQMVFAADLRRQAGVCVRLAEDCDDRHLAERLRMMASDLLAKADDLDDRPGEGMRHQDRSYSLAS